MDAAVVDTPIFINPYSPFSYQISLHVYLFIVDRLYSLLSIYNKYQTRRDTMSSKKRDYY